MSQLRKVVDSHTVNAILCTKKMNIHENVVLRFPFVFF